MRYSVAMTGAVHASMREHLVRDDEQEDVLAATYLLSTGARRTTAVIQTVITPLDGERLVHGNASFTSSYVLRAAAEARTRGEGLALLHSHPRARGWQDLSNTDHDTEADYERVARAYTRMPLLGMTLAGRDAGWSARFWLDGTRPSWAESVRCVSDKLAVTWNDNLMPAPQSNTSQQRTISAWGNTAQASIARLRVLIVGTGSVGLDIAQRMAATGLLEVGVMDFDAVEPVNLDRMIGATRLDAALGRAKVSVAARLMTSAATGTDFHPVVHEVDVTDPAGLRAALDYDLIFSCVDRPWPRAVLNQTAYADLIPVIDGGISLDSFPDGRLRGGIWRAHTLVPGRPCMVCLGQLDLGELSLDMQGLLDDPTYIAKAGRQAPAGQNVAALSASVSAALLAQFVSLVAHPGGRGVPAPLRYLLAPHRLVHSDAVTGQYCSYESETATADRRPALTRPRTEWRRIVGERNAKTPPLRLRLLDAAHRILQTATSRST
ncbi:ThiF family adenylyltransferase [Rhodococcus kroppenstedtii]|uniref:HesA/MoeB/ThiF family protein n=1 Tax=Rhodococcoides kroppenstedtii TaxID=293050 RepID=UPI00295301E5|nr:ThiF family adenylyltransferase [Rhodococcus kroppenstedtii]MDV7199584.1 ThiF family adenylyltransferase [Rhodococcus kroppenstedtii]